MKTTTTIVTAATCLAVAFAFAGFKSAPGTLADNPKQPGAQVPSYNIVLTEYVNPNLPNLHSYTQAVYKDKIVMFGGRRRGLHSVNYNFSQNAANKIIYVVDTHNWNTNPAQWTVYSQADSLTAPAGSLTGITNAGQFRANNAEFFTSNDVLYVIGGLIGATSTNTTLVNSGPFTLPYMSAITLSALTQAVINQTTVPLGAVRQVENPKLAITGGEVSATNNTVTLAFGWNVYNPIGGLYTHQISTLTYTDSNGSLNININPACATCTDAAVTTGGKIDSAGNAGNFRRRDGSMSAIIDPATGKPCLMYFAGVFKNGNTNFTTPIWIQNNSAKENTSFNMRGNVYTCKIVSLYSKKRKESYATLLGGMTNSSYSFPSGTETPSVTTLLTNQNSTITTADVTNFLSVPFFNGFTTIKIDKLRNMSQYMMPTTFPTTTAAINLPSYSSSTYPAYTLPVGANPYNGAESEIFWHYDQSYNLGNDVLDLDKIAKEKSNGLTVGYHFGGLLSVIDNVNMNNTSGNQERLTVASNRIFAISVVPVN